MAVTAPPTAPPSRKYNPGFLSDDELVASFCVRTSELESIVEVLRECTGSANPHQIVIGPRGSGKTSLLLRVAAEVRRDASLSSGFFPVVFAEESYEVGTAGEFWLECLSRLADQAPHREGAPDLRLTVEDLRAIRDDRTLGERCLAALLDFSDREGKRLVLMVENLNMMFGDMADSREAGWRLRKTLQTEPRIILLASATSRFDEIDHPDRALYDLFRVLALRPLDTSECAILWETVSGQHRPPETIRSLEILTGGSPRLLAIVARFGAGRSFRELMAELLDLVDDHTEYFKSHLESLPAQERRVYLALADLWKPALTKEIADRARIETSKCSAQLTRLIERGAVLVAGGSARRKQYYLSERLYNVYYLLRRRRRPDHLIEALIRFMASYYSPPELKDIGVRVAREAEDLDPAMRSLHQSAFEKLVKLPAMAGHREELLATIPAHFTKFLDRGLAHPDMTETTIAGASPGQHRSELLHDEEHEFSELADAGRLLENASVLYARGQVKEALAKYDELVRLFGESDVPGVSSLVAFGFFTKGVILGQLDRQEDALAAYDEMVLRFDSIGTPNLLDQFMEILVKKDAEISELQLPEDMPKEAMNAWNEMIPLIEASDAPTSSMFIAAALVAKGGILCGLNRPKEALAVYEDVMHRFGESNESALVELIATALVNKGLSLVRLNRPKEALGAFDEVGHRFGTNETPDILEQLATALFTKGDTLTRLSRAEEALAAYDELARRFGTNETPAVLAWVAKGLVKKGEILRGLGRLEEGLAANDEVLRRVGESNSPGLVEPFAAALVCRGFILHELDRPREALASFDDAVYRFRDNDAPTFRHLIAFAFYGKASVLTELNRTEETLAAYDEAAGRIKTSEHPALRKLAGSALLAKANLELADGRYEAAIETAGRVLDQPFTVSPENRWDGRLIRARVLLARGDLSGSDQDIEAMLAILPKLDSLSKRLSGRLDGIQRRSRAGTDAGADPGIAGGGPSVAAYDGAGMGAWAYAPGSAGSRGGRSRYSAGSGEAEGSSDQWRDVEIGRRGRRRGPRNASPLSTKVRTLF